jgi:serine/threonine protein kinase
MCEVYRAQDSRLKRAVAMKIVPEAVAGEPERIFRFECEAELLASLNHPNIAIVHDTDSGRIPPGQRRRVALDRNDNGRRFVAGRTGAVVPEGG